MLHSYILHGQVLSSVVENAKHVYREISTNIWLDRNLLLTDRLSDSSITFLVIFCIV